MLVCALKYLERARFSANVCGRLATNSFPKSEKTIRTEGLALNEQSVPILNGLIHGQRHKVFENGQALE